jgi:hypothetical protein
MSRDKTAPTRRRPRPVHKGGQWLAAQAGRGPGRLRGPRSSSKRRRVAPAAPHQPARAPTPRELRAHLSDSLGGANGRQARIVGQIGAGFWPGPGRGPDEKGVNAKGHHPAPTRWAYRPRPNKYARRPAAAEAPKRRRRRKAA